jgi:hypothetical protein
MKKVYLIGFLGTGYRQEKYAGEPSLIHVGHVGIAFEGDEMRIYGFHPVEEAFRDIGDENAVMAWLKQLNTLPGTLQLDTAIFLRAHELAKAGARTKVWETATALSEDEFERVKSQALLWYTEQKSFSYSFPPEEPLPDRDNCATFPRRLGLRLPEATGKLAFYIPALAERGSEWHPKEVGGD